MRQLLPEAIDDVDPIQLYAADERPGSPERPWVMLNMISSIDGAISIDGVSGGLGGPADKRVFSAIRGVADVILVGSGTVVAENYRRPQTPPEIQGMRVERGQSPLPRLAIVTNRLNVPRHHQVLDAEHPPIIVTHEQAPADKRRALEDKAEIVVAGESAVDVEVALEHLGALGMRVVLLEGGPTLNAAVVTADRLDELCLTLSPLVVGGDGAGIVNGAMQSERRFHLDRLLQEDDLAFFRYVRTRPTG